MICIYCLYLHVLASVIPGPCPNLLATDEIAIVDNSNMKLMSNQALFRHDDAPHL